MHAYARVVLAIAWKELLIEFRSRETIIAGAIFALLVVAVFALTLDVVPSVVTAVAPVVFWITILFAGIFTFNRLFGAERDSGSLDGMTLVPVDLSTVYLGKCLSAILFMAFVAALALPSFTLLLGAPVISLTLLLIVMLGIVGLSSMGTLFGAIAIQSRSRDVLLSILLLPISLPLLILATGATFMTDSHQSVQSAAILLAACDVLYITAGIVLFPTTVEG